MGEQLPGWLSENMSPKHFGKAQMLLHVGHEPHVQRVTAMFRWNLLYVHVWINSRFVKTNGDLNKARWMNAYGHESNGFVQTVWTELRIWHAIKCCCRCFQSLINSKISFQTQLALKLRKGPLNRSQSWNKQKFTWVSWEPGQKTFTWAYLQEPTATIHLCFQTLPGKMSKTWQIHVKRLLQPQFVCSELLCCGQKAQKPC